MFISVVHCLQCACVWTVFAATCDIGSLHTELIFVLLWQVGVITSVPSVLWRCWLGGRKGIRPIKNWAVGCWRGCLSGVRCWLAYMSQLMPLPLAVSCFSKIQIGFTFLVPAHPGSLGKRAVKRVCVCVGVISSSYWRYYSSKLMKLLSGVCFNYSIWLFKGAVGCEMLLLILFSFGNGYE